MKKLLALILAASMLLCFAACEDEIEDAIEEAITGERDDDTVVAENRIARYGVAVSAAPVGMCDIKSNIHEDEITATATVKENVFAPGTNGSVTPVVFAGTNEIDVELDVDAEFKISNFEVEGEYYCPLMITVGEKNLFGADYDSARQFEEAVEDEIEIFYEKQYYKTGTNFSTLNDGVKWEWAFGGYGDDEVKDTALGEAATAGKGPSASLTLSVEIDDKD